MRNTSDYIFELISDFWGNFLEKKLLTCVWNGYTRSTADLQTHLNILYNSLSIERIPIYWERVIHKIELEDPIPTFNSDYPFAYKLKDASIIYTQKLYNTIGTGINIDESAASIILEWEADFLIEAGTIAFKQNPAVNTFYCEVAFQDEEWLYQNYGNLIDFKRVSSYYYWLALQGVWYTYWKAPTIGNYKRGLTMILGLLFAYEDGIVEEITNTYIKINGKYYTNQRNLPVIVNVGDFVKKYQPLVDGVSVKDYITDPHWYNALNLEGFLGGLDPNDPHIERALELLKHHSFALNVDYRAFNNIIRPEDLVDFVIKTKPTHTNFIFIIYFPIDDPFEAAYDEYRLTLANYHEDYFPMHGCYPYGYPLSYFGKINLEYGCDEGDPCVINLIEQVEEHLQATWKVPKFLWLFGDKPQDTYLYQGMYGIENTTVELGRQPEFSDLNNGFITPRGVQIDNTTYPVEVCSWFEPFENIQVGQSFFDLPRINIPNTISELRSFRDDWLINIADNPIIDVMPAIDQLLINIGHYVDDLLDHFDENIINSGEYINEDAAPDEDVVANIGFYESSRRHPASYGDGLRYGIPEIEYDGVPIYGEYVNGTRDYIKYGDNYHYDGRGIYGGKLMYGQDEGATTQNLFYSGGLLYGGEALGLNTPLLYGGLEYEGNDLAYGENDVYFGVEYPEFGFIPRYGSRNYTNIKDNSNQRPWFVEDRLLRLGIKQYQNEFEDISDETTDWKVSHFTGDVNPDMDDILENVIKITFESRMNWYMHGEDVYYGDRTSTEFKEAYYGGVLKNTNGREILFGNSDFTYGDDLLYGVFYTEDKFVLQYNDSSILYGGPYNHTGYQEEYAFYKYYGESDIYFGEKYKDSELYLRFGGYTTQDARKLYYGSGGFFGYNKYDHTMAAYGMDRDAYNNILEYGNDGFYGKPLAYGDGLVKYHQGKEGGLILVKENGSIIKEITFGSE